MAKQLTWQERKMRSLYKGLDFNSTEDYYNYIIGSKINGNRDQCCRLFRDMPKENRKDFLSYLVDEVQRYNDKSTEYELLKLLIEEI